MPAERDVVRCRPRVDELFQHRHLDVGAAQVLTRLRQVVDDVGGPVEVPLARGVEQLEGVFRVGRVPAVGEVGRADHVDAAAGDVREEHAFGRVVPARLGHGDGRAVRRGERAARLGPLAEAVALDVPERLAGGVDELDVLRVAPVREGVGARGVAGGGGLQGHRQRAAGALFADAVDVELPAVVEPRGRGRGEQPGTARAPAASPVTRTPPFSSVSPLPCQMTRWPLPPESRGVQAQRLRQPEDAGSEVHGEVARQVRRALAHEVARLADGPHGPLRGARSVVGAGRRDVDIAIGGVRIRGGSRAGRGEQRARPQENGHHGAAPH